VIAGCAVLAVVVARGGSKGVPGKNILPVGGKPLIQWTIDAALQSQYIDRLILSSDDPAIIETARAGGCEVPFQRDPELAKDDTPSADVLVDALQRVPGYGVVVLLQPTSPLRTSDDIDGAIELFQGTGAPACVSVCSAGDHPYWVFRIDEHHRMTRYVTAPEGLALRRQDLPPAWTLNGALYIARTEHFLRCKTFLSEATVAYAMPPERSLDIDTPADLERFSAVIGMLQARDVGSAR